MRELLTSLRLLAGTVLACCVVYPGLVWLFANAAVPDKAEGSLVYAARGGVVGSKLIAQRFTRGEYFWPRPSAVDYNASATGGSNLSPASPQLAARAGMILQRLGAGRGPVPADLVTASGSGVDPHISLAAARWQAPRVAAARRVDEPSVLNVVERLARPVSGWTGPRLVNVLLLNLALDEQLGTVRSYDVQTPESP